MRVIVKRYRGLRKQGEYSQQRLSKTLDIPQSSLFRYESGETEPSTWRHLKCADFFQGSQDYTAERPIPAKLPFRPGRSGRFPPLKQNSLSKNVLHQNHR